MDQLAHVGVAGQLVGDLDGGDLGVDVLHAELVGEGHSMVTVDDEVQSAHLADGDRGEGAVGKRPAQGAQAGPQARVA